MPIPFFMDADSERRIENGTRLSIYVSKMAFIQVNAAFRKVNFSLDFDVLR